MRKATHMERDDIMSTIYELFVSAGITYGTIQATGWAKYNDSTERKRFVDKRMDDFVWAGLTRSSTIGSPLSIATDIADTLGVKKSYRTTTGANRFNHKVSNPNEAFWKAVSQSPSLDTSSLIWDNISGYNKRGLTKNNLKDTLGILIPANTNWKAQLIINGLVDSLNIPKK